MFDAWEPLLSRSRCLERPVDLETLCPHLDGGMSTEVKYAGEAGLVDDGMKESLAELRSRMMSKSGYACEKSVSLMGELHFRTTQEAVSFAKVWS